MLIFVVALFVLPSMLIGFWLGQRARVARQRFVGVIEVGKDGYPAVKWVVPFVPLHGHLYMDADDDAPITVDTGEG